MEFCLATDEHGFHTDSGEAFTGRRMELSKSGGLTAPGRYESFEVNEKHYRQR